MGGSVLIGGLGIALAVFVAIFYKLSQNEDEGFGHFALQILFLGFIMGGLVLVGKATLDYKDNCAWLVSNSTTSGTTTNYNYTYECSENTNNTSTTFYKSTLWVMIITSIYLLVYFAVKIFYWMADVKRGGAA